MGRLVGKQVHRGGGADKQPQRQERSHGLQGGNEHQNDQGENAVADEAGGDSQRGGDVRVKEADQDGAAEEQQDQDADGADGEGDPQVGVGQAHDGAKQPVVNFLLQAQPDQHDEARSESRGMQDGKGGVLVQPGCTGDEEGTQTHQQGGHHSPRQQAPAGKAEEEHRHRNARQQGAGKRADLEGGFFQDYQPADEAVGEADHDAGQQGPLRDGFAEELEKIIHHEAWVSGWGSIPYISRMRAGESTSFGGPKAASSRFISRMVSKISAAVFKS